MRYFIFVSFVHVFLFLIPNQILAATSVGAAEESLEIILDRRNHLGFQKIDLLSKDKSGFYFDGKKIGTKLPALIKSHWEALEKGPEAAKSLIQCSAGQFEYKRTKDKKTVKVVGCTEGTFYGNLISHIEALRDYAKSL
jgi:hypothetical protein